MAGNHVGDDGRHEERRNTARPALHQFAVGMLDARQAADPRADVHPDALGVLLGHLQTAVFPRLDSRREPEMDEGIHVARVLRREVSRDVEFLHFAGDAAGKRRGVKARDRADSRFAGDQIAPGILHVVTDRADDAEPGNGDSALRH